MGERLPDAGPGRRLRDGDGHLFGQIAEDRARASGLVVLRIRHGHVSPAVAAQAALPVGAVRQRIPGESLPLCTNNIKLIMTRIEF